jgi:L-ascorbate metabolism protein UlaG (beta-lactamase superfamily)
VFDYWSRGIDPSEPCLANGHINPDEIFGLNVEVFVTHEHADHYDSVIFGWENRVENLTYIFGFKPEDLAEPDRQGYRDQSYEYVEPRSHRTLDGMTIHAIESNDAGVGFLVEVDGLCIYHAGDHAGWTDWDTGPETFKKEIDYLADMVERVDFAFVNVTGCRHRDTIALENSVVYTLEKLSPRIFVPTHGLNREHVYQHFIEKIATHGVDVVSISPRFRGDHYLYKEERIL